MRAANLMTATFDIHQKWESASHEPPEVRHTAAMLRIIVGDDVVTRNEDEWAQTVRDEVRLPAYPLALWFASSWWRLRWEPVPMASFSQSWRMAHEMSAAGHGYVWPRMLFASDGQYVNIWTKASRHQSKQAIRYLVTASHAVVARDFEMAVDEFISGVLARLDAMGVERTTLRDLWNDISSERANNELTLERRLEAMLGFDPDEAPENLLKDFRDLIPRVGAAAVSDIAPVCASADPKAALLNVLSVAGSEGLAGHISLSLPSDASNALVKPSWYRGREMARLARTSLDLAGSPISDGTLCDILGVSQGRALAVQDVPRLPISLGVLESRPNEVKFAVRKRNKAGRRFELARLLCDYLMADEGDRWLPVSDAKTARQRTQRAFAAEFLCPIQALEDFMSGDFTAGRLDQAAEHFSVSTTAVQAQLVNNRLFPAQFLREYGGRMDLDTLL